MGKYTTEELGRIGEGELERWALREHLVANPVKRDVRGYDFVLEFEEGGVVPAFDLATPVRRAFVQVKASHKQVPDAGIKLSNWKTMVLDSNPWFVFFVQIDRKGEVRACFLRHVDPPLQARALKALRTAKEPLHTSTLRLAARKSDRLSSGQLRTRIEEAIQHWQSYSTRKSEFTRSAGYENNPHTLLLTFPKKPNDGHIHEWVDAALGLPVELQAKRIVVTDNRFSVPVQVKDVGPATLRIAPPGSPGTVRVAPQGGDLRRALTLPARVFSTAINPNIPQTFSRARFSCGPLDLVLDLQPTETTEEVATLRMNAGWNYDERTQLVTISRAASALLLMATEPTTIALSLNEYEGRGSKAEGSLQGVMLLESKLAELRVLAACKSVAHHVDLSTTELSSGEIVDFLREWALASYLISGEAKDVSITTRLIGQPGEPLHDRAAIVFCPTLRIGNRSVVVVGAFVGPCKLLDNSERLHLEAETSRLYGVYENPTKVDLDRALSVFAASLETEELFVVRPGEPPEEK